MLPVNNFWSAYGLPQPGSFATPQSYASQQPAQQPSWFVPSSADPQLSQSNWFTPSFGNQQSAQYGGFSDPYAMYGGYSDPYASQLGSFNNPYGSQQAYDYSDPYGGQQLPQYGGYGNDVPIYNDYRQFNTPPQQPDQFYNQSSSRIQGSYNQYNHMNSNTNYIANNRFGAFPFGQTPTPTPIPPTPTPGPIPPSPTFPNGPITPTPTTPGGTTPIPTTPGSGNGSNNGGTTRPIPPTSAFSFMNRLFG